MTLKCALRTGVAVIAAASGVACAQSSAPAPLIPFVGDMGYQEIRLREDSWYLAYHGNRKHAIGSVEEVWLARAGQLCGSIRKPFVVELRYVDEPVYANDSNAGLQEAIAIQVAGPVFIPLFISSGPQSISPTLTPSKASAIRCVDTTTGLRPGRTAIAVSDTQTGARKPGSSGR